jgi:hypothetical protein
MKKQVLANERKKYKVLENVIAKFNDEIKQP